jgi:hypothetical protein
MPTLKIMQTGRDPQTPTMQIGNTIDLSKSKSVEETMDKVKKEIVKEEAITRIDELHEIEEKYEKLQEEYEKVMKENTSLKKALEQTKKNNKKNLEMYLESKEENQKIKEENAKPITYKDTRCSPFNVKVNANWILELMEMNKYEIDFDDYELWDGFDEVVKENLMIQLAQNIDGYINEYCTKPSNQLWNEYLVEEFSDGLAELLQNDYYSQYIKYEVNEDGDWKYTPIKQEDEI